MERRRHRHYRRPPVGSGAGRTHQLLANPKYKAEVHDSQAGAVIVSPKAADEFAGRNLIVAADPYLYFAKVARLFSPIVKAQGGVHPTAVVEASAKVPASCEIGANAYIGANAVLGEGCRILANAVVQHDCMLGDEVVLHPNSVIYYGCTLGNRVEIHSGAVIGADGFGLAFAGDSWFKIPQTGAVTLGDDVEIGSNTNIDRGAMSDTTVGNGTKIDNQVQIGHNCKSVRTPLSPPKPAFPAASPSAIIVLSAAASARSDTLKSPIKPPSAAVHPLPTALPKAASIWPVFSRCRATKTGRAMPFISTV